MPDVWLANTKQCQPNEIRDKKRRNMKNIKIKTLTISNFKGQSREVHFGENENRISGHNGSGKSTLMRAFFWCLTGYTDANAPKNDNLYDNKQELTKDTPKASVKAILLIDGDEMTIERTATAKFQRKRGTDEYVKASSDEYHIYIDGIEFSATDYEVFITNNLCDYQRLKYALDGSFFISDIYGDKKRARKVIEDIIGSAEQSEMQGEYPIISSLIEKFNLDQIEEQARTMKKNVGASLDEIPVAIRSKQAMIADINQTDFKAIQKEIDEKEKELKEVDAQIFDLSARMRPVMEAHQKATSEKAMKQNVFDKAKNVYWQLLIAEDNNLVKEISAAEKRNNDRKLQEVNIRAQISKRQDYVEEQEKVLQQMREERDRVKALTENVCPTCGATITGEQFEEQKRKTIDSIVAKGKDLSEHILDCKADIEDFEKQLQEIIFEDVEPLKQKLIDLRTKDIEPFEQTEQGIALQADIDAVVIPELNMPDDSDLQDKRGELQDTIRELYLQIGIREKAEELQKEVAELQTKQREVAEKLGYYERQQMEVKRYRQEQMDILSRKVNKDLSFARIDIWSVQKDGSVVPDVVLKDKDGVAYATTNGASRILTSVDIQRFFCEKLDVNMPCWIDECSIIQQSNLPEFCGTQAFCIFCADTQLKIESK